MILLLPILALTVIGAGVTGAFVAALLFTTTSPWALGTGGAIGVLLGLRLAADYALETRL